MSLTIHLTVSAAPTAGTLVIANITESDFGSYICTSQNVAGATYCELDFYDGKLLAFKRLLQMQMHFLRHVKKRGRLTFSFLL